MKKSVTFACLILLAAAMQFTLSFKVYAQENAEFITEIDLDEDGLISIREAVANLQLLASFGKIDIDGDGKISPDELASTNVTIDLAKQL